MLKPHNDSGSRAAALLATCYVMAAGLLICSAIALSFSHQPSKPILIVIGLLSLLFVLLWLLRDKPRNQWIDEGYDWLLQKRRDENSQYAPRVVKPTTRKYGTNTPPTLEEIRKIAAESSSNWVPSNATRKRRLSED